MVEKYALVEGAEIIGWRDVPVRPDGLGETADAARPRIRQVFLAAHRLTGSPAGPAGEPLAGLELDRVAFCVRKQAERETAQRGVPAYFPSLSARTMVYKGMLTPDQLPAFYPDLTDPRVTSAIALVHSRFSTNTFPSWPLAHPYRLIAHNGEINTIRGNKNWMQARKRRSRATVPTRAAEPPTTSPATSSGCSRSAPPAAPTRPPSTRCSNCCTWPVAACRTRC
ncbi:hypothetical protein GCM10027605_50050 [Micromonospora zhanjiangensis]